MKWLLWLLWDGNLELSNCWHKEDVWGDASRMLLEHLVADPTQNSWDCHILGATTDMNSYIWNSRLKASLFFDLIPASHLRISYQGGTERSGLLSVCYLGNTCCFLSKERITNYTKDLIQLEPQHSLLLLLHCSIFIQKCKWNI